MNVITGTPSSVLTFLESPSRLSGRSVLFRKKGAEQWSPRQENSLVWRPSTIILRSPSPPGKLAAEA